MSGSAVAATTVRPRAATTSPTSVVQTVDEQRIVLVADARLTHGDIVGDESLSGRLMSAGGILDLVDRLAGALAGNISSADQGVATISIDRVDIQSPIAHGDLLRMEGEVINIGRTSLVVQMTGYRYDLEQTKLVAVLSAIATFVAVDLVTLRPKPGLPKLVHPTDPTYVPRLETIAKQRKKLAARWCAAQNQVDQMPHISTDMVKDLESTKSAFVSVQDTLVEVQTTFLPKNLNRNNTIHGGDVMAFMDKVALQCAKGFAKNRNMVTVSMSRILFKFPIRMDDIVTMMARVCSVRRYDLEVEVEVFISHIRTKARRKSHTGYFTVVNLDQLYRKTDIPRGLLVDDSDQVSMRIMLKAQHRYSFDSEERKLSPVHRLPLATTTSKTVVAPRLLGRL
ncbi:Protein VdlD [Phytophthora ramorum]|uniref:Protein VdlD n=1 Tax=Phytophthora ramorum TaxID=164328 RepID=UPI003097CEBB|nr:Protein VdlD [Phytophthora ramorum]